MLIAHTFDIALAIRTRRRQLKLRQLEVAKAAGVGREWLCDLEHGKPTVELGMVMRTLATLGLEIDLRPSAAAPAWTLPLTAAAIRRDEDLAPYRPPSRTRRARPAPEPPPEYRAIPETR